jgi:hypothetical protein
MNLPALWHRLRGADVFTAPPEVSAISATSGYCLPTLGLKKGEEDWHGSYFLCSDLGPVAVASGSRARYLFIKE